MVATVRLRVIVKLLFQSNVIVFQNLHFRQEFLGHHEQVIRAVFFHVRVKRFLGDWLRRRGAAVELFVRAFKRSIFALVRRVQLQLVPFQNSAALQRTLDFKQRTDFLVVPFPKLFAKPLAASLAPVFDELAPVFLVFSNQPVQRLRHCLRTCPSLRINRVSY